MSIPTKIIEYRGGWYCRWYDVPSQRTRWKKLAPGPGNRRLAEDALRALQAKIIGGPSRDFARVTISRYYSDHYQADYLGGTKHWNKLQRDMVRDHILPRWGTQVMSDISLYDVQSWYRGLLDKFSRKYANHIVSVFKTMLHRAEGAFIASSPIQGLRKASPEKNVPATLSREDVAMMDEQLGARDRALMLVWIQTGLRPGEMQWLQWGDIDLDNAKLFVRNKRPMSGGNAQMKAGHRIKDAEERYLDLTASATRLLREHRGDGPTPAATRFVFPNDRGQLMASMGNHVWKVLKSLGIRNGSANLLRHTFASMFLSSGGHLAELKQYMGHSTITITEQHYAAFIPGTSSSIHKIDFGIGRHEAGVRHVAGTVGQPA